jgi:hypothetical protein
MAHMRSDGARVRARQLLRTAYPVPHDAEFHRLRALAIDYIREADRLAAESRHGAPKSGEMVSAALDAMARDFFARAASQKKQ